MSEATKKDGSWGKVQPAAALPSLPGGTGSPLVGGLPSLDRTAKLYVGGKQARPDGSYCLPVKTPSGEFIDLVGDGNRKDIRNAVEAASKAAGGWGKRAAHNRAQICYYIAENLSARAAEFAARICKMTGCDETEGMREVEAAISRLFTWGAWADKYGGSIQVGDLPTMHVHTCACTGDDPLWDDHACAYMCMRRRRLSMG